MTKTKLYTRDIDELYLFEIPAYLHGMENYGKFCDIKNRCRATYKISLPRKASLIIAYMILYMSCKELETPDIQDFMHAFPEATSEFLKDAFYEFRWSGLNINFDKWMAPLIQDNKYDINQIVFLDYVIRHPELLKAMFEIKELENSILHT